MDKEKETEGMAKALSSSYKFCVESGCSKCESKRACLEYGIAEQLTNAGYGNVKQAVKEFADWIKERIHGYETISNATDDCLCDEIDEHFNELYDEEVEE